MADPAKDQAASPPNNSMLTVRIHGKIDKIDQHDGENGITYMTLIIIPSGDPMKSPTKIQVKSKRKLGRPEEMIDIKATVSSRYWKNNAGKVNHTPDLWVND
jgi:hypothetical protein